MQCHAVTARILAHRGWRTVRVIRGVWQQIRRLSKGRGHQAGPLRRRHHPQLSFPRTAQLRSHTTGHAGATGPELMAVSGHASLAQVQPYIADAEQARMAEAAMLKRKSRPSSG